MDKIQAAITATLTCQLVKRVIHAVHQDSIHPDGRAAAARETEPLKQLPVSQMNLQRGHAQCMLHTMDLSVTVELIGRMSWHLVTPVRYNATVATTQSEAQFVLPWVTVQKGNFIKQLPANTDLGIMVILHKYATCQGPQVVKMVAVTVL